MRIADVREERVGGRFRGAKVGEQQAGVGGQGLVLGQAFQPEHARQARRLQLGEHGLADDR
jgi:hypothetical protein